MTPKGTKYLYFIMVNYTKKFSKIKNKLKFTHKLLNKIKVK